MEIKLSGLEYQSQASPLLPGELAQAYLLLHAAREAGENFFVFYNCGFPTAVHM